MVEYLNFILSEGCIEMDPIKVAGICDWPTLRNLTKVQSFIGFVNFYQRFIQDFSHIAKPLHQLTKKGETRRWAGDKQKAFKELKWLITSTPILVQPDQDAYFRLETDTSGYSMGSVLSQLSLPSLYFLSLIIISLISIEHCFEES